MFRISRTRDRAKRAQRAGPTGRSVAPSRGFHQALAHRQQLRQTLWFCLLLFALIWITIAARPFYVAQFAQHVVWGTGFSLVIAAFAYFTFRQAMRDIATADALQGSEQQRMQAQAEREYLAQLVHSSTDAIISRSIDGTILSWNPAAERLFGYTAEEAIGRSVEIIVPPEHLAGHRARGGASARGPREVVRMAKDGRLIDIELTTGPIRSPSGEVIAVSVIARDITAAKAADAALRASEARLREAQRLAHIGSWELDLRAQALTWSDEIYRIFELEPSAFGASYAAFLDRVHPDDRDAVNQDYTASVAARQPYSIDHRLLMPDGRVKHVHEEGRTEYDEAGKPLRSMGTVQDITERKLAEEARARLAAIVENANDAIIGRTLDGNVITSWNAAAERLFGYTAAEVVGRPMAVIASAWPRRIGENTERLKRGKPVPGYESQRRCKDGSLIPVFSNVSPINDHAGNITGVAVIIRDMREEKKAQEQRSLAASVFEHAAEGIIVTDAENHIVSVNRAFIRITGYTLDEVSGRNPRLLSSGVQQPQFYRAMWEVIKSNRLWQGEVWDKRKNGELYCQSLSITAIVDEAGNVRNYCAIFMDVTRRKNAEAALLRLNAELEVRVAERTGELQTSNELLRQANEELNAFSYSVSHDLRAPLRRVHAYTSMALDAMTGAEPKVREWLERVKANAEAMGHLVEDMLRLSLVTRKDLDVSEFDVSSLAREVAAALREQDTARHVEVEVQPDMTAHGDAALVRILLENLIGNARKFSRGVSPAVIRVGTTTHLDRMAYYVQDNGAGFDPKRVTDIFKPFARLHPSDEYEGSGIGLSIVQRIVNKHGGSVWATADVGKGATFYFILPRRCAVSEPPVP